MNNVVDSRVTYRPDILNQARNSELTLPEVIVSQPLGWLINLNQDYLVDGLRELGKAPNNIAIKPFYNRYQTDTSLVVEDNGSFTLAYQPEKALSDKELSQKFCLGCLASNAMANDQDLARFVKQEANLKKTGNKLISGALGSLALAPELPSTSFELAGLFLGAGALALGSYLRLREVATSKDEYFIRHYAKESQRLANKFTVLSLEEPLQQANLSSLEAKRLQKQNA